MEHFYWFPNSLYPIEWAAGVLPENFGLEIVESFIHFVQKLCVLTVLGKQLIKFDIYESEEDPSIFSVHQTTAAFVNFITALSNAWKVEKTVSRR